MKIGTTFLALSTMLAAPTLVLAQSTTAPVTRPPAAMSPAYSPSSSTATYTTADQMTRASKVIGATVYNDQNQSVGSINELLIDNSHDVSSVVLSVGGFLGIDSKLVKVPFQDIRVTGNRLVMAGASKEQLKQMPDYKIVPATSG